MQRRELSEQNVEVNGRMVVVDFFFFTFKGNAPANVTNKDYGTRRVCQNVKPSLW